MLTGVACAAIGEMHMPRAPVIVLRTRPVEGGPETSTTDVCNDAVQVGAIVSAVRTSTKIRGDGGASLLGSQPLDYQVPLTQGGQEPVAGARGGSNVVVVSGSYSSSMVMTTTSGCNTGAIAVDQRIGTFYTVLVGNGSGNIIASTHAGTAVVGVPCTGRAAIGIAHGDGQASRLHY